MSSSAHDRFASVVGDRRGSWSADAPARWWLIDAERSDGLSAWLARMERRGSRRLVLTDGEQAGWWLLDAHAPGTSEQVSIDADVLAWLLDAWPASLRDADGYAGVTGWLRERT